jgi:hypothetical protein
MQNKIAIVLPVRDGGLGRHARLSRCLKSYYEMTEGLSDIHLLHDEDECDTYHPIAEQYPQVINYCIPAGITLMQKINVHALEIASKYKYVGFIGDDIVFKTPFEQTFINYLSTVPYGMVFANDLVWKGKLATHPFITSNAITAVGFFGCPAVEHNFFDNYWHLLFSRLGNLKYTDDVVMEHMHPLVRKEVADTIAHNISMKQAQDSVNFERYVITRMDTDIGKVRNI